MFALAAARAATSFARQARSISITSPFSEVSEPAGSASATATATPTHPLDGMGRFVVEEVRSTPYLNKAGESRWRSAVTLSGSGTCSFHSVTHRFPQACRGRVVNAFIKERTIMSMRPADNVDAAEAAAAAAAAAAAKTGAEEEGPGFYECVGRVVKADVVQYNKEGAEELLGDDRDEDDEGLPYATHWYTFEGEEGQGEERTLYWGSSVVDTPLLKVGQTVRYTYTARGYGDAVGDLAGFELL